LDFFQNLVFLGRYVEGEPGRIVGPIAGLFGFVLDFLFNIVHAIHPVNSLGFAIILITIVFRGAMLPLTIKSQKSMMNMRKIQPELKKIDEKYGKSKDPEIMKKAQQEKTALMAAHDANPLKDCLPMLLQMPLFVGLIYIMRQAFLYITTLRNIYQDLAEKIIAVPGIIGESGAVGRLDELCRPFISDGMLQSGTQAGSYLQRYLDAGFSIEESFARAAEHVGEFIAIGYPPHLARVLNRFTSDTWNQLFDYIRTNAYDHYEAIVTLFNQRADIETFFGLNLVENAGLGFPGIIVPILVAVTSFASAWLMNLRNYDPNADDKVKMQQRMMLVIMPGMMAFITITFPIAVGIYWIASQLFGVGQDLVLNYRAGVKFVLPFAKPKE